MKQAREEVGGWIGGRKMAPTQARAGIAHVRRPQGLRGHGSLCQTEAASCKSTLIAHLDSHKRQELA
jgi:hypothetical protein